MSHTRNSKTVETLNLETSILAQFREKTYKYIRAEKQYNILFNANKEDYQQIQKQEIQRNKKYSVNI